MGVSNGWFDKYGIWEKPTNILNKNVSIIGSGPAALECAYHLRKNGVNVNIYEKDDVPGGLLRYGIPDHKLPKSILDYYCEKLAGMGINFYCNENITLSKYEEL